MIKNRLKEILAKKNIKQSELVEFTGATKGTISNIVNNKYEASISVAFKISQYLNMSVEDIFYDDDCKLEPVDVINTFNFNKLYEVTLFVAVPDDMTVEEIKQTLENERTIHAMVTDIGPMFRNK